MAFPDSRFDFRLELALGADLTDSPLEWDWTDFSDRIRQSTLSLPRGRPSEGSQVAPSQLAFDLDNVDGAVTPNLESSPFYPFVRKGTPVRYWAEGATPGLILDGSTGTGAWTAAHADFDFAGDFEIRARIRPDQWAGARLAQTRQAVARKAGSTAGNQSFAVELAGTGTPATRVNYSGAGLTEPNGTNRVDGRVADTRARWVGWVWDHENVGGIGYAVAYSWPAHAGDPPADITDWDLVAQSGDAVTTTRAAASSTAVVELGMANGNSSFRGVIERVEFRDGVNGTLVADPDFTDPADVGAATVTDSFGKVWTLTGSAEIGTRRLRFAGSIVDLSVQWPLGDNRHSAPDGGSECWTSVVAGASIYHINQGSDPIRSALFRKITTNSLATAYLFDYWPMEVGSQAALAPSALGLDSMTLSGFTSTDSTILSSEPLPSIGGGQECAWYAPATAAGFLDNWGCSFVFRFTDPDSAYRRVMAVETAGTAARWEVLFSSSGFRIRAVNGAESQLFSTDEANPVADTYAGWWVCYLRVQQSGGNMLWQFDALPWNDPSAITADTSGTTAGTVGAPTAVGTDTATPSGTTFSVGHVALYESLDSGPNWTVGWLDLAANAWIGETAAGRFARLCWEENIPGEVLGDYLTYTEGLDTVGDLDLSEPMGPQLPGPLLEVLRRCAALDGGLILERSTSPGLIYRTRAHIEAAQAVVALAVDGDVHAGLRPGLQFTLDYYRYRNSWNVKADNGGLATVSDATEVAKEGTVSDTVTMNSIGGVALGYLDTTRPELSPLVLSALDAVAARLVAASIVTEPRIARLAIELSASPELIAAWQDLAGGDRVTVSNLPDGQWAATDVDLTVEGTKETWSPTGWLVELACSPTAAWISPTTPVDPEPLAIVGAPEWEYDTAAATVTNPDPVANGNTVLAIAFGQGTANAPTTTVVPPPGVTATELTGLAVTTANIRLRAWTYPNDGAGSKTFGYSAGADNRSACILIPLDGVATVIIEGGTPIVGNGPAVAFPSVSTELDDLVIPFAGRRANSETPGSLGGFFVIDDDTAAAVNPQGAAWFAVTASTPTTTPPSLTWSGSANTHAQAVVAFRGEGSGGGGGLFPAAAQVDTADLTIDMQAVDSSTWGKDAEGQKILGGGRFNQGADDNIGSLVWESDDETINSFAMQDGETERIKVSTAKGLTVVETAVQYVVDGSYEIPDAGNSFQGYVDSPPSDRLFFDGSRSSWSHIALGHTVGPAASPIVMGGSFIVQPWMLANDNTSGPLDLHAPTSGQTGPIANYCSNGQLYLAGKYSVTPWDPDSTSNLPVGWQSNESIDLAAIGVGNWCTQVVEFVVDPGGIGYYNWYGLNHSTGEMLLVEARGNDWGWIFDEADPGYTDENDNFYLILPAQYHYHQYEPTGATENWDAAGASAAGAAFPNVRRAQWRWYASSQAVTAAQLMGHGKWSLGIT